MGVQICPFPPVISMSTQHCGTVQKPNSLLFNLEEEVGCIRPPTPSSQAEVQAACERLQAYTKLPPTGWPSKLLRDVRRFKRQLLREDDRVDVVLLAAMLSEIGYSVVVRCALGGAHAQPGSSTAPGSCFRNLRHEFLFVRCDSGEYEGVEMLVDPEFRQQFQIPQPSNNFRQVLQSIPEEFVGTSMRLQPVVELICAEMAASFEARGLTIPPWRRPAAMLSKWLPTKAKDISVDAGGSSPRHASPNNTTYNVMSGPQPPMLDVSIYQTPQKSTEGPLQVSQGSSQSVQMHQGCDQAGRYKPQQQQQQQQQQEILPPKAAAQQQQQQKELVINVRRSSNSQSPDVGLKEAAQQLAALALHNQRQASPTYRRGQQQLLQLPAVGMVEEPLPTPTLVPVGALQNVEVCKEMPNKDTTLQACQDLGTAPNAGGKTQIQAQDQEQELLVHIRTVDTGTDAQLQQELKPNFERVSAPCVLPSFDGQSLLQNSSKLPIPTLSGAAEAPGICELKRTVTSPAPGPFARLSEPYRTAKPSAQVSLLSAQLASHPASPTSNGFEPPTALDWRSKAAALPINLATKFPVTAQANKRDSVALTSVEVPTIIPPKNTAPQVTVAVKTSGETGAPCTHLANNAETSAASKAQNNKQTTADANATGHANMGSHSNQGSIGLKPPQPVVSGSQFSMEKSASSSTAAGLPFMSKQQPVHKSQPVIHKVRLQQQSNQQPTAPAV